MTENSGRKLAMELLMELMDSNGADKLIPINSAHISVGCSGELGKRELEFLRELVMEGSRATVRSTMDPIMGLKEETLKDFKALGINTERTCAPYLTGNLPKTGENLAWSGSFAVIYANSVLEAKTNGENFISALASSITGLTPNYGLHLDENRRAGVCIRVKDKLFGTVDYAAVGYYIAREFKDRVISFDFKSKPSESKLKVLSAALSTSGSIEMFKLDEEGEEIIEVGDEEIVSSLQELDSSEEPDLICLGCPHYNFQELKAIAKMLKGRRVRRDLEFCVICSESVREMAELDGYTEDIERAGAKLITNTCALSLLKQSNCILTDSALAAHYSRKLGVDSKLDYIEEIVKFATTPI